MSLRLFDLINTSDGLNLTDTVAYSCMGSTVSAGLRNATDAVQGAVYGRKQGSFLVLGLQGAGLTTLLYRLGECCRGEVLDCTNYHSCPGFSNERLVGGGIYSHLSVTGGAADISPKLRYMWRRHYFGVDGVVWLVDSVAVRDQQVMQRSTDELHRLLCEEDLRDCPLLVVLNKQDLPEAMTTTEIAAGHQLNAMEYWTNRAKLVFVLGTQPLTGCDSPLRRLAGNSHLQQHIWSFVGQLTRFEHNKPSRILRHREHSIQACCATNGDGVYEVLDWMLACARHAQRCVD